LYPNIEVTDFLKENTLFSRFEKENNNLVFPSNSWSLYGLSSPSGQDALTLLSTSRYLSLINYENINDEIASRYNSIINLNSPLFNTLNVSYYSAINWLDDSPDIKGKPNMWLLPKSFKEVKNIKTIRLFKNESNIGIAWFPQNIICEKNDKNIFTAITSDSYDPVNVIYVNCDGWGLKGDDQSFVSVDKMSTNSMLFSTNTKSDNYLIVSSAFYPGWNYRIDGSEEQNVNKADAEFIAVKVPKGIHKVEIRYEPPSFVIGLSVTAVSLFIFLCIYFIKIKKVNGKIILKY